MNRSQYLPYTAYTIAPYPSQFGAPGYQNVPGKIPAPAPGFGSATPLAYPPPTYIQQPHHHQRPAQAHQNLSAWPIGSATSMGGGGYAPVAGQIEDIVSPPLSMNALSHPPLPSRGQKNNLQGRIRGHIPNGIHPSSLPQVQDVFAPRQPPPSFGLPGTPMPMPLPMSVPGATSRMVGAYPPMPPQNIPQGTPTSSAASTPNPAHSQGSSPIVGMPQSMHVGSRME
ncbi:hypothetical protein V8F20_009709 [Naviculisporaceae sp. PSN 640]